MLSTFAHGELSYFSSSILALETSGSKNLNANNRHDQVLLIAPRHYVGCGDMKMIKTQVLSFIKRSKHENVTGLVVSSIIEEG